LLTDTTDTPGQAAAQTLLPVLASALRDGDTYSPDGVRWHTFCPKPHLHLHTDPPPSHADPADTDIVHVSVTPLAAGDVPANHTRFVHRRQREQVEGVRVADWPYVVCEVSRVTSTSVYYRTQDHLGGWHANRTRFADEVGGIIGGPGHRAVPAS